MEQTASRPIPPARSTRRNTRAASRALCEDRVRRAVMLERAGEGGEEEPDRAVGKIEGKATKAEDRGAARRFGDGGVEVVRHEEAGQ